MVSTRPSSVEGDGAFVADDDVVVGVEAGEERVAAGTADDDVGAGAGVDVVDVAVCRIAALRP